MEAPAGSGKTGLLIQRYLKLLATVDQPAEVLALTFTRKATGEMRARVVTALGDAAAGKPVPDHDFDRTTRALAEAVLSRNTERGWAILQRPHLLNIRTIDALCGEIARAVPLLSGSAAVATPVDDPTRLYAHAAHAVMLRLGGSESVLNDAISTLLLHRDGNLQDCERALASMLATRDQWGRLVPLGASLEDAVLDGTVLPRLNKSLQRAQCAALERLHHCFPEAELARLADIARELSLADAYKDKPNAFAPCAAWSGAPGLEAHHVDHWLVVANLLLTKGGTWRSSFQSHLLGVTVSRPLQDELKDMLKGIDSDELQSLLCDVRTLPPAEYPPDQWHVAKALFRLLQAALVELRLLFAREGVCDFTEVSLAAQAALQTADVQVSMGTRLRHLLLDEMQDSSSGQYDLLRELTLGWDGSTQTVFLVGDPKQSIYLFRQARVELFQQCVTEQRLGDIRLQPLSLSANFRSGQGLVDEFNETFRQVFPADRMADGDVTYSEASAVLPANDEDGIRWHGALLQPSEVLEERLKQRRSALRNEALLIATVVEEQRRVAPGSTIAVLTRVRSHVAEVAKALARRGVPYRAVDIDALSERREVLDVVGLTRALLHPADRTAWLAVLRSPWCGIGLADLHHLAAGDNLATRDEALRPAMRHRAADLQPQVRERVLRTLDVMDAALRHTGVEPLTKRVERTWRSLGGDRCVDALGEANVRQFLRLLNTMEQAGDAITLHTLQQRLGKLFAKPDTTSGAVDVMTIHKAKGLEWDVVLVPGLHRRGAQDGSVALNWLELPVAGDDGDRDVLLAPFAEKGGRASSLYAFVRSARSRRAQAELKRVFYVAATRARTILHLFATPDAGKDGSVLVSHGSLLKAAGTAAPVFAPLEVISDGAQPEQAESDELQELGSLALAASAEQATAAAPVLERLSSAYDPLREMHRASLGLTRPEEPASPPFLRPGGSFGARAVGTAIHRFIERLAYEFRGELSLQSAETLAASTLAARLPSWSSAVQASLRGAGLPAGEVLRASRTVLRALHNLLETDEGRWILQPHRQAVSEAAWRSLGPSDLTTVRLDRSFFAGSRPLEPGEHTLWIVDFKTTDKAPGEQEHFLQEEKERYTCQLENYARLRVPTLPAGTPIMLALAFPLMRRLLYWPFKDQPSAGRTQGPGSDSLPAQPQLHLFT